MTKKIDCRFIPGAECNRGYGDCEDCPRPQGIGWHCIRPGKWERLWMPRREAIEKIEACENQIKGLRAKIKEIGRLADAERGR